MNTHRKYVRKGEKGIKILAPVITKKRRDRTGNIELDSDGESGVLRACKIVTVFDVSQTEGEPLPEYGPEELTGDAEQFNGFMAALESVSPAAPKGTMTIWTGASPYRTA